MKNTFNENPIKGFKDIDGNKSLLLEEIIEIVKNICKKYGIRPIQTPIIEKEELFIKSLGNTTDIVTKEIFRIISTENLILRPEQTSSIMRWSIKNRWDLNGQPRVYSYGPMFRHENPQKGRWRQFNQFNIEFINNKNIVHDGELLVLSKDIITSIINEYSLKKDFFILKINTIGSSKEREEYQKYLKDAIGKGNFSEEAKLKILTNPIRVLDTKNINDIKELTTLKTIINFLTPEQIKSWEELLKILDDQDIHYEWDKYLVRGLDYYNDLVFEWVINDQLFNKPAVLAGGRYDGLSWVLTEKYNIPAIGFALGLDRLIDYIDNIKNNEKKIIAICNLDASNLYCLKIASIFRKNYNIQILNLKKIGDNLSWINKNQETYSHWVIILGKKEEDEQTITIKNLNEGNNYQIKIMDITNNTFKLLD